jgi:C1A family cysteine protease
MVKALVFASTVVAAAASCSGSADPADITSDICYTGSAGALGLKETVTVTIHDFANSAGHIDVVGSGIEDISCKGKSVSKSGQDLSTDLSDCLPSAVSITSIKYCSDSDTISVTVKDKSVPLPVSATLKKTDCASVSNGLDEMWNEFTSVHAVNGDEAERKAIFAKNVKKAVEHNRKELGSMMGVQGPFAAMTLEEFQSANIRGFQASASQGLPKLGVHEYQGETLADSVDWTTKGAVTPVKNQGQCGSCWAFSTVGGLEGAWEISSGNLVSLSEQQFVDCDKVDSGCNGGLMDNGFKFAEGTAIATEDSYAYTAKDGSCKSSFTTGIPQGGVTGYKDVSNSASALQSALQSVGPVSVAIEADQSVFQMYTSGTITSGCGSNLDHGVLAVGYDGSSIKVKNSWGSSWGMNGYVNIDASQCGITTSASYPTVSASVQV